MNAKRRRTASGLILLVSTAACLAVAVFAGLVHRHRVAEGRTVFGLGLLATVTRECRAISSRNYMAMMGDEYQGGFSDETIQAGASIPRYLSRVLPAEHARCGPDDPLLSACRCPDTLVLQMTGMGWWSEAFDRTDGELVWAEKATDFNAYCGGYSGYLVFGAPQDDEGCECIPLNPRGQDLVDWTNGDHCPDDLFDRMAELHRSGLGEQVCAQDE